MGKLTLQIEVDEAVVRDLEARGIDPLRFAEAGFSEAYARAKRWSFVDSAREKAKDPEGSLRRAQQWAEENREALAERKAWIEQYGLLSDHEPFAPAWLKASSRG